MRVPGRLDFYGDFRIGGPFTVIGGFNADLGFATTNNASRSHEFYALPNDATESDHYVLDGTSVRLQREQVTVEARDSTGRRTTTWCGCVSACVVAQLSPGVSISTSTIMNSSFSRISSIVIS